MVAISLFKVGLAAMFFFVLASNVINYVAIATSNWNNEGSSLWYGCTVNVLTGGSVSRSRCFLDNPYALIATGTALNALSLVLMIISMLALFLPRFRDSIAMYFVIAAELCVLLSLVFNSTGWYFILNTAYQGTSFVYAYSFWLMTAVFAASVIAAVIGSAILGCTCVTNRFEAERRSQLAHANNLSPLRQPSANYFPNAAGAPQPSYYKAPEDPQILRL